MQEKFISQKSDGDKLSPMDRFCEILIHATQMGDCQEARNAGCLCKGEN